MTSVRRVLAGAEILLVSPATLFMTALFVRNLQPQQYEPAHTAQQIVEWFAARPKVGLWLLLIALPLSVVITGAPMIWRCWNADPELRETARSMLIGARTHVSMLLITGATLTAAVILAIVALHMATD